MPDDKKLGIYGRGPVIVFTAAQGLPGPDVSVFNATLGENAALGDIMFFKGDGKLYLADKDDTYFQTHNITRFFMPLLAGEVDDLVGVKYTGLFTFPNPVLVMGTFYYLGNLGKMLTSEPSSGMKVLIGQAISTTQIFIVFEMPTLVLG